MGFALAELETSGVAYDPSKSAMPPDSLPSGEAIRLLDRFGTMWRSHLLRDPIFNPAFAAPLVWLGFLIENAHRASMFPAIVRQASHAAPSGSVRRVIESLANDEDGHLDFFLEAISAFGIDARGLFEASAPLLETRALCWFLGELACSRPISLVATCSINETSSADARTFDEEARRLAKTYGVPESAVHPILEHGLLDAAAEHGKSIDLVLASQATWDTESILSLLQDMHDLRHVYGGFLTGIREHYGAAMGAIPNTRLRWSDFLG